MGCETCKKIPWLKLWSKTKRAEFRTSSKQHQEACFDGNYFWKRSKFSSWPQHFFQNVFFTETNKATASFNTIVTNLTRCFTYSRYTKEYWLSEKPYSISTASGSEILKSCRFKMNFSNTREIISVKKVREVAETVLSTLGVTRISAVADLWVEISDWRSRGILDLIDLLL